MSKELVEVETHALALPGNIDERVAENLANLVRDKGAFAANTWKALQSVMRQWAIWCDQRQLQWLPIQPETMREYLNGLHESGLSVATVKQHYAMMCKIHKHAGLPSLKDNQIVSLSMRRITRQAVEGGERTGQAIPFRLSDLERVAKAYTTSDDLADARDLAFLSLAYNTLLRIAEIGRLRLKDVESGPENRVVLRVGYTKKSLTTDGEIRTLSHGASQRLRMWLEQSRITDPNDFIFCTVDRWGKMRRKNKPLSNTAMESIFARAWYLTKGQRGVPDEKGRYAVWTGHSARVGAAQDMAMNDVELGAIMKQGGWKRVDMVMRYIRNLDDADNAFNRMIEGM